MAIGKLDHLDFTVDNLEKAEEFFTKKLGFKFRRRIEHWGESLELTSPAGDVVFELHQAAEKVDKAGDEMPSGSLNHLAFLIDDPVKELARLKAEGVPFSKDEPNHQPATGRYTLNVSDTSGDTWIQLSTKDPHVLSQPNRDN